jgi:hypothetical protein
LGYDLEKLVEGPRSEKLSKRRRINRILNILIGIVFVLILFFGWKFLLSNNNQASTAGEIDTTEGSTNTPTPEEENATGSDTNEPSEDETSEETEEETDAPESESTEHEEVTDGDPDSNIIRSIENRAWTPIGTSQSEPHTIVYDSGSTDRTEMERAISYALGYDLSNITVWELARDSDNRVAATISTKDNSHVFRVYIEWVTDNGWKPLKIDELRENDSKYYTGSSNEANSEEDSED